MYTSNCCTRKQGDNCGRKAHSTTALQEVHEGVVMEAIFELDQVWNLLLNKCL